VVALDNAPAEQLVSAEASYLITGGLGALGLAIAETLAQLGAGRLLLAGRSKPEVEVAQRIQNLKAGGVDVQPLILDVADEKAVSRLVTEIQSSEKPLKGIVHCAGVLRDGPLAQASAEDLNTVLKPKVNGSWNLHSATDHLALDFFVLFSSASALVGWPGQSNYAAGNSYLDALAHYRQARGLPALSINWGVWADGGMASRAEQNKARTFSSQGLIEQSVDAACADFVQMLSMRQPQLLAGEYDWRRFVKRYAGNTAPMFFDSVLGARAQNTDTSGEVRETDFVAELEAMSGAEQGRALRKFVEAQAAQVLGIANSQAISRSVSLNEQGLDSLLAVELRNKMAATLASSFPASLLFDYPTVNALAEHIAERLLKKDAVPVKDPVIDESKSPMAEEIDALTESEAEAELLRELNAMSETSQSGQDG
ncbi:MAG: beta-ketoacyl reductase, partial [Pseudomonadota bacterium]